MSSAFIFLRWFKFAHICIQATSLHKWKKQGFNHKFLIGNQVHVTLRIVSPIICKQCQQVWNVESQHKVRESKQPQGCNKKKRADPTTKVLFYLSQLGLHVFFIAVLRLFTFSDLVLAFPHFTPVSIGCRWQDWQCVLLREIDFLLKICD